MAAIRVNINPKNIVGAIQRAGIDIEEYLNKHTLVRNWISGEKEPTVKQLEGFSKTVHIPFGFLFLQDLPQEPLPFPFFRTNGQVDMVSINVRDTIRQLQLRQDWLSEYLIDQESNELEFVSRFSIQSSIPEVVENIRATLGLKEDWALNFSNWTDALKFLIKSIENSGIIVVLNGVVGNSNKRPIEVNECRGFVLIDKHAPFMFINAADTKAAQMFTILHELAHIWVGRSAGFNIDNLLPANDPIEIFCDKVAAEFLVPQSLFLKLWDPTMGFELLARRFKVSPIVIARRAMDFGALSRNDFFVFYNDYMAAFEAYKSQRGDGGNFAATLNQRISPLFARYLNQATQYGELLYRDAYRLSGLKADTYHKFIQSQF